MIGVAAGEVVVYLERTGEECSRIDKHGDVADELCKAMNEATAISHEMGEPVIVKAKWPGGETATFRITVEAL